MKAWLETLYDRLAIVQNAVLASPRSQRLAATYTSLPARDQIALKLMGIVILIALVYLLAIQPAQQFALDARATMLTQKDTLQWMQSNAGPFRSSAASDSSNKSLLNMASLVAQKHEIAFKRFQPLADTSLNLWLEDVRLNNVVLWVEDLDKEYGVSVRDIQLNRTQPGLANIRVSLQQ